MYYNNINGSVINGGVYIGGNFNSQNQIELEESEFALNGERFGLKTCDSITVNVYLTKSNRELPTPNHRLWCRLPASLIVAYLNMISLT